jgi:hypothetical protein
LNNLDGDALQEQVNNYLPMAGVIVWALTEQDEIVALILVHA